MTDQVEQIATWEPRLLSWANEALDQDHDLRAALLGHATNTAKGSQDALRQAHSYCDRITKIHSRTFYLASGLLPAGKREAVRALYAFCRLSDNLVDMGSFDEGEQARIAAQAPLPRFQCWRDFWLAADGPVWPPTTRNAEKSVALAWADAQARYRVPRSYTQQFLDGVASDLEARRYATFDELAGYCYGVASTVGLMTMHIVGFNDLMAVPYAIKLGVALQLTNILRDVGEDWRRGRLYLPQQELATFGLSDQDIAEGRVSDAWRSFMRFQIARARRLYAEARPGILLLNRDARFAVAAAANLYEAILEDIEANGMDVFSRRAHVGHWGKLRRLPGTWLSYH